MHAVRILAHIKGYAVCISGEKITLYNAYWRENLPAIEVAADGLWGRYVAIPRCVEVLQNLPDYPWGIGGNSITFQRGMWARDTERLPIV